MTLCDTLVTLTHQLTHFSLSCAAKQPQKKTEGHQAKLGFGNGSEWIEKWHSASHGHGQGHRHGHGHAHCLDRLW